MTDLRTERARIRNRLPDAQAQRVIRFALHGFRVPRRLKRRAGSLLDLSRYQSEHAW